MISMFKAIPLGVILTLIVCLLVGSGGSDGGHLNIFNFTVEGYRIFWSWRMFLAGTGLCWALIFMMDD